MYAIEIKPKAIAQLRKAAIWYNSKQLELGTRFLNELENSFTILAINPFYAKKYKNVRGYNLKNFPFLILFKVDEENFKVSIVPVFHTAQDPRKYPQ
ncbi:MAG: type II toxin-antitoxin system RelE/ParE family toxin [Flammeovirgaceae bacterium]|jgi:mRNA-degrading endonuclease RelE of RelBE toxin-antitoxin system|nr:type II toxin-antitoxin system RelE/ParE family toxin [Flammeovirgaceae bacterium]